MGRGTWELRNRINDAAIVADVQPLEAQLAEDARAELEEHHVSTLTGLYAEIRQRVGKADGSEGVEDRGCSAFVRMHKRTAARLFTGRLDYLARHTRKGRVESRRWVFDNTTSFYVQVFPKTRLRLLGCVSSQGEKRLLTACGVHRLGICQDVAAVQYVDVVVDGAGRKCVVRCDY
eukprot:COSAG01_NODE_551_length_15579_cov_30.915181_9_plen_176_part_00